MTPVLNLRKVVNRHLRILLIFVLLYLLVGLGFHFAWKFVLEECREARLAEGEFVEDEVFGNILGVVLDVTYWPVYVWANLQHGGTPLATPCTQ